MVCRGLGEVATTDESANISPSLVKSIGCEIEALDQARMVGNECSAHDARLVQDEAFWNCGISRVVIRVECQRQALPINIRIPASPLLRNPPPFPSERSSCSCVCVLYGLPCNFVLPCVVQPPVQADHLARSH